MKRNLMFIAVGIVLLTTACKKEKTGNVTFWQETGSGYGLTVVSLNDITSNITTEYTETPSCGASGCAVFNGLPTGTYNYSASDGTDSWSGNITITEGCLTVELF